MTLLSNIGSCFIFRIGILTLLNVNYLTVKKYENYFYDIFHSFSKFDFILFSSTNETVKAIVFCC